MTNRRENRPTLIDKLADELKSQSVKFAVSTLLIGGGTYLLFTSPLEQQAIRRDAAEYSNGSIEAAESPVVALAQIANASARQEEEIQRRVGSMLTEITQSAAGRQLNVDFVRGSEQWLSATVSQLERDRGRANGFVFTDALEQGLQREVVAVLNGQRDVLAAIGNIITRWEAEDGAARDKRLEALSSLWRQNLSRASGIESIASQLMTATRVAQAQANQRGNEILGRIGLHQRNQLLAVAGIVVGLGFVGWIIVAAARR